MAEITRMLAVNTRRPFSVITTQDVHSPEGMKFPNFSRLKLNSDVCLRLLGGLIFKIRNPP